MKNILEILNLVIKVTKLIYLPVAIFLVAALLFRFHVQFFDLFRRHSAFDFVYMVALASSVHLFSALSYYYVLRGSLSGPVVGLGHTLRLQFSKLPARYLPGGVWHSAGKVSDLNDIGYKKKELGRVLIKEMVVNWGAALGTFVIFFSLGYKFLFIPIVALLALVFFVKYRINFYKAFLIFLPVWSIYGSAFYIFVQPVDVLNNVSYISVVGHYSLSALIGFFAIFAPQGIGVTEFSFLYLQGLKTDLEIVIPYLVAFRCIVLLGDVLAYLAYIFFKVLR